MGKLMKTVCKKRAPAFCVRIVCLDVNGVFVKDFLSNSEFYLSKSVNVLWLFQMLANYRVFLLLEILVLCAQPTAAEPAVVDIIITPDRFPQRAPVSLQTNVLDDL
ncbi:hypothetical protein T06_6181 [Trichinella sp. T6]|nr:hypothetical protein T06_6181 [Trichinella sp. T6]